MNMLVLKRQKHDEPRLDELSKIISDLETFLEEAVDFKGYRMEEKLQRNP